MDSFNVLRGREPIKKANDGTNDVFYCAGYIKFLPKRGRIYGIEFSGHNTNTGVYRNPGVDFDYYIFCSENAWINYVKEVTGVTIKNKLSKAANNIGNPATFVVSSDTFKHDTSNPSTDPVYPHNIGFSGSDYDNAEPRPYSNVDAFINSDDVQYPLYIFVKFGSDPNATNNNGITELDYQLILED